MPCLSLLTCFCALAREHVKKDEKGSRLLSNSSDCEVFGSVLQVANHKYTAVVYR